MMRCSQEHQNRSIHAHLMMGEWSAPLRTAAGQLRPGQTAAQDIPTHPGPGDVRVTSSHHHIVTSSHHHIMAHCHFSLGEYLAENGRKKGFEQKIT